MMSSVISAREFALKLCTITGVDPSIVTAVDIHIDAADLARTEPPLLITFTIVGNAETLTLANALYNRVDIATQPDKPDDTTNEP